MKRITVLQTTLSISEVEKRLSENTDFINSFGLKIRSNFPRITIGLSGWESGRMVNQHLVKFSARISANELGTIITGYFRYSYLFSFFWPFLFGSATYFLYMNSGKEYLLAPIITALIGLVVTYFYILAETRGFSVSSDKGKIIGGLKTLLDVKN